MKKSCLSSKQFIDILSNVKRWNDLVRLRIAKRNSNFSSQLSSNDRKTSWEYAKKKSWFRSKIVKKSNSLNFHKRGTHLWKTMKQLHIWVLTSLENDIRRKWKKPSKAAQKSNTLEKCSIYVEELMFSLINENMKKLTSTNCF